MKKVLLLLVAIALFTTSFAASGYSSLPKKATEIYLPVGQNTKVSLMELSTMKVKDYEHLSGKHLNFFQKLTFKAGQKKLRDSFSADGTITNKKLLKAVSSDGITSGLNLGWLALGFFLGLIGVLLSYVINGEEDVKRNRQKWAWIGFGVWVIIIIIAFI